VDALDSRLLASPPTTNIDLRSKVPGQSPLVSFGLPIRNGEASISKCIDSILAQDLDDFEVVICDNRSNDRTVEILQEYAAKDERIRFEINEENIGLIGNFNHVLSKARGTYFRWIGADDWLEPGYASSCVKALDGNPDAIVATTFFGLHRESGGAEYQRYFGEYPDSPDPARRVARMLYFFLAGAGVYEPTYAMMRRDALLKTHQFQIHRNQDWLLSIELSLAGSLVHVPECLFHRTWPAIDSTSHYEYLMEAYPQRKKELEKSVWRLMRAFNSQVASVPDIDFMTRLHCNAHILLFSARRAFESGAARVRRFRRQELGLTRELFGGRSEDG
jgi:glycosyltransferase involved in cell wall biosynthesis